MNRKGFTLIELLTSLTLTSVVCILLFQILFILKDIYTNDSIKTELLIKTANISESINSTFRKNKISTIRNCQISSNNCLKFTLDNGNIYELKLDRNNKAITFGNFSSILTNTSEIYDDLDVCYFSAASTNSSYDTFIRIRIPVRDNLLEENFDINVIYQYLGIDAPVLLGDITVDGSVLTYIPSC